MRRWLIAGGLAVVLCVGAIIFTLGLSEILFQLMMLTKEAGR